MRCTERMRIIEILRLREIGLSYQQIAKGAGVRKSTVGDVMRLCQQSMLRYRPDVTGFTVRITPDSSSGYSGIRTTPHAFTKYTLIRGNRKMSMQITEWIEEMKGR
jgi:hypothetical protein